LRLSKAERTFFTSVTGRSYDPPPGGWTETAIIRGVRSGKSSIAAAVADYESLFPVSPPPLGEADAILVAQDQRGALRTLLSYARSPFERSDVLKGKVVQDVADVLKPSTRISLAAYPSRPEAVRMLTAVSAICDELALFTTSDGRPTDLEMLRVLRGRLATTGGKLLILSSPYAATGALYDLHRQHYGVAGSTTLVIQATSPQMNPTLRPGWLEKMATDDPDAYRSEVLGELG
jgi:hypothetical protein